MRTLDGKVPYRLVPVAGGPPRKEMRTWAARFIHVTKAGLVKPPWYEVLKCPCIPLREFQQECGRSDLPLGVDVGPSFVLQGQVLLMTATSVLQVHFVDANVKPASSNPFLERSQHLSGNREPAASSRMPLANQAAERNCIQAGMQRRQGGPARRGTS